MVLVLVPQLDFLQVVVVLLMMPEVGLQHRLVLVAFVGEFLLMELGVFPR